MRKIDKKQIVSAIQRNSSWWGESSHHMFQDLPKRMHYAKILSLVKQRDPTRALVLMGPRRVGKTVILYQVIDALIHDGVDQKKILFASLDNPLFRLSSLEEIVLWGFESTQTSLSNSYVFFDEVQYLENWEQQLKVLVDMYPEVKFVVTGSATAALHKKSKESGAGRFTDYMLPPLSFYEYMVIKAELENLSANSIDLEKLNSLYIDYLNYGGFPESLSSENVRDFPEQYIGQDILDKVLMRDLPSVFGITNPSELNRLFAALAYNTANEVSLESITQTSGVSKNDINRYLDYFEAAFLVKIIDRTDNKNHQFKRRTFFKVILSNPSLRSAIFGKVTENSPELEGLAETAIFSQLVIYFWHFELYKYARWNRGGSKGEVDLIHVNKQGKPVAALEIKWTDRFAEGVEEPKSLLTYCRENSLKTAYVTSKTIFCKKEYKDISIHYLPTSFVCLMMGYRFSLDSISKNAQQLLDKLSSINEKDLSEKLKFDLSEIDDLLKAVSFLKTDEFQPYFEDGFRAIADILKI